MPRAWVDGVETVLTDNEWGRHAAAFLGCGFRVVTPAGPVRPAALAAARQQAVRIAELFDATWDEAPWRSAASGAGAIEIVGGWRHQFRGPAGAQTTVIRSVPLPQQQWRRASGVRLPWSLDAHSPVTGLPMISGLEEDQALRTLETDTVGLWWNTDGHLVQSTAGPLLLRVAGAWLRPPAGDGAVPHFVWSRAAELLDARESPVDDKVLAAAEAVHAVDSLGRVVTLRGAAGADELLDAVARISEPITD
ncbi:hypothetical protein [Nocardioides gilvus]|uniref:hypothetical protein n=1 Tax=Nocardioides gilvus TaxID=1735589 RepID=UPI000D74A5F8|nr:hypothetical protein [Nocardioides gilvus]